MILFHDAGPEPDDYERDALRGAREPDLDEEFPLGDGTAETESVVMCPYCGELNDIALDPGSGPLQRYVEDCQVCCQPWQLTVRYDARGEAQVTAEVIDDG